ncbi:hypothetical protein QPL79_08470 [Ignisphaera sp. 4213-co]|uniref:Uncharacterized protein n=1 Tax=Ignisphaera cupida TaxID=3050454 RepID=A0ABD4ZAR6_9CREN|nr:hypothetical protein [Ignisphaera sp. 4213-co]MDK6029395.1 hypothetical protein [Ignisphaera sp. 4213-co]
MRQSEKQQTLLVYTALAVFISAIVLAILQRYVASFISLLAGVVILSYSSGSCHEKS